MSDFRVPNNPKILKSLNLKISKSMDLFIFPDVGDSGDQDSGTRASQRGIATSDRFWNDVVYLTKEYSFESSQRLDCGKYSHPFLMPPRRYQCRKGLRRKGENSAVRAYAVKAREGKGGNLIARLTGVKRRTHHTHWDN